MPSDSESTTVTLDLPFGLTGLNGTLSFRFRDVPASIKISYEARPTDQAKLGSNVSVVGQGAKVEVLNDPYGKTHFSRVRVTIDSFFPLGLDDLDKDSSGRLLEHYKERHIVDKALKAELLREILIIVNMVIDSYCWASKNWQFPNVFHEQFSSYRIEQRSGNGSREMEILFSSPVDSDLPAGLKPKVVNREFSTLINVLAIELNFHVRIFVTGREKATEDPFN